MLLVDEIDLGMAENGSIAELHRARGDRNKRQMLAPLAVITAATGSTDG